MELNDGKPGMTVRVTNWAGPCLTDQIEKVGRSRFRLFFHEYAYPSECHTEPCTRCTDHPQTSYPRGYEG